MRFGEFKNNNTVTVSPSFFKPFSEIPENDVNFLLHQISQAKSNDEKHKLGVAFEKVFSVETDPNRAFLGENIVKGVFYDRFLKKMVLKMPNEKHTIYFLVEEGKNENEIKVSCAEYEGEYRFLMSAYFGLTLESDENKDVGGADYHLKLIDMGDSYFQKLFNKYIKSPRGKKDVAFKNKLKKMTDAKNTLLLEKKTNSKVDNMMELYEPIMDEIKSKVVSDEPNEESMQSVEEEFVEFFLFLRNLIVTLVGLNLWRIFQIQQYVYSEKEVVLKERKDVEYDEKYSDEDTQSASKKTSGLRNDSMGKKKVIEFNGIKVEYTGRIKRKSSLKRDIHCECWGVIGHVRRYKSGKIVQVQPFKKGIKRNENIPEKIKEYHISRG